MKAKLFTLDKNYILKEVQIKLRTRLLRELITEAKTQYLKNCNPLGVQDSTITAICNCPETYIDYLDPFYFELAGIYRLKYGENQLEFLFDGTSHFEKYKKDWSRKFNLWTREFMDYHHFIRAILEGSFLSPDEVTQKHVQIRLKLFLEQRFQLRIYKYRGIRKLRFA